MNHVELIRKIKNVDFSNKDINFKNEEEFKNAIEDKELFLEIVEDKINQMTNNPDGTFDFKKAFELLNMINESGGGGEPTPPVDLTNVAKLNESNVFTDASSNTFNSNTTFNASNTFNDSSIFNGNVEVNKNISIAEDGNLINNGTSYFNKLATFDEATFDNKTIFNNTASFQSGGIEVKGVVNINAGADKICRIKFIGEDATFAHGRIGDSKGSYVSSDQNTITFGQRDRKTIIDSIDRPYVKYGGITYNMMTSNDIQVVRNFSYPIIEDDFTTPRNILVPYPSGFNKQNTLIASFNYSVDGQFYIYPLSMDNALFDLLSPEENGISIKQKVLSSELADMVGKNITIKIMMMNYF